MSQDLDIVCWNLQRERRLGSSLIEKKFRRSCETPKNCADFYIGRIWIATKISRGNK